MTTSQAQSIVALLLAHYPRADWPEETQAVYRESIEEFDFDEARRAVARYAATVEWPSLASFRHVLVEARLDLPSDVEAWELASEHAAARRPGAPRAKCYACMTTGHRIDGSECEDCSGAGWLDELDLTLLPPTPDPIPRAVRFVGGWRAIRESEHPGILRRDFLDAYRRMRSEVVERENLRMLGANVDHPLVEAAARREIGPGE